MITSSGIECEITDEVDKYLWAKMLYNCALNPLESILNVNYGKLTENEYSIEIMNNIIDEIFEVIDKSPYETFWNSSDEYKNIFYSKLVPDTYNHYSSTHQDIMNKQKTEIDSLNGKVIHVTTGTGTLKDACSAAFREWTNRISDTHYCLGSVMGPHPFPTMVRDFQAVISKEIKEQLLEKEGKLPDAVIACVGGGSNAIGAFYHFIDDPSVRLIGCEAAGRGVNTAETAATIATGRLGIFHGMKSYFCQDQFGQIAPVYSISAGLDYPGIGPEHAHLHDTGRAEYVPVTDEEAVEAFEYLSRMEGIIPAIESAHAVAYARKLAPTMGKDQIIVINISGRGDKDCAAIARYRGEDLHE